MEGNYVPVIVETVLLDSVSMKIDRVVISQTAPRLYGNMLIQNNRAENYFGDYHWRWQIVPMLRI